MTRTQIITLFFLCGLLQLSTTSYSKPHDKKVNIDEVPMYGGMDRSKYKKLKKGDKKFILGVTKEFGSKEIASKVFVDIGFKLYIENNLKKAMQRFNQAWLLNPNNPAVYAGFASVLHDQGKNCESMNLMITALNKNPPNNQGIYPDAGRIFTLCAMSNNKLTDTEKILMLEESEKLFQKAEQLEQNKAYVFGVWATAYYWQGKYQKAWDMVNKQRNLGDQPTNKFLALLSAKFKEPIHQ
jgi:tetratricopeptide (TPR) repeat protein